IAIALDPADAAPGLADEEHTGCNVPGLAVELPETVLPAGSYVGQIERTRAQPAQAANLVGNTVHLLGEAFGATGPVLNRQTAADQCPVDIATRRDSQPPVVEIGPTAFLRSEQLVAHRVVDHTGGELAVLLERYGDGPMRQAVQEVGRPIE